MALLSDGECRRSGGAGHAAEESIGQGAKAKQVLWRSEESRVVGRCGIGRLEAGPVSWNQRPATVGQDQDEPEAAITMCMAKNGERSSMEWMMTASDFHLGGKVSEVGSVWWFPSIM
jgi:hypothetical protein